VVKHLSLHQAVFASKLFQDAKFQDVPASHAKEEVTRTVVEHCSGTIRSMLESIEALKLQAALRKHHVHRKVHALKLALPRKRMIKSTCKTAQKVSPALKTTTIVAIQNANAVVVVVVVANVVKTKVQALRTKMVHQTCNRPSRTLSQWMA
jgi:hypothetical protein